MKRSSLIAGLLLMLLVLVACGPGLNACTQCEVTDIVTNTEVRNNGAMIIWVRTDTTSAYCTFDKATFELARDLREKVQYATIEYASINSGDKEAQSWTNTGGCDPEMKGVRTYKILALRKSGYEAQ